MLGQVLDVRKALDLPSLHSGMRDAGASRQAGHSTRRPTPENTRHMSEKLSTTPSHPMQFDGGVSQMSLENLGSQLNSSSSTRTSNSAHIDSWGSVNPREATSRAASSTDAIASVPCDDSISSYTEQQAGGSGFSIWETAAVREAGSDMALGIRDGDLDAGTASVELGGVRGEAGEQRARSAGDLQRVKQIAQRLRKEGLEVPGAGRVSGGSVPDHFAIEEHMDASTGKQGSA